MGQGRREQSSGGMQRKAEEEGVADLRPTTRTPRCAARAARSRRWPIRQALNLSWHVPAMGQTAVMDGPQIAAGRRFRWRALAPRDRDETHRASTPLELLFDLTFVIAVAQVGGELRKALIDGQAASGLLGYLTVFFAIWWAWMNFTWFASAYDCDDVVYRLLTLVQITGVLVLAAGVPRAFEHRDFDVAFVGYLIIRAGLVS